jgi:Phospholipase_D-nuclease N-terminal
LTVIAASTAVWVFILIPLAIVWAIGIVDIVRRPLSRAQTAAWILLVVLLPLIGTLVYFLMRKPTEEEILGAQAAAAEQRDNSTSVHQRLPGE